MGEFFSGIAPGGKRTVIDLSVLARFFVNMSKLTDVGGNDGQY